uniref:RNA polymerase II subunit A C-terminal domain phosphatase n=1 Tax=Daphnia galeata TaxID=27404 RepID=A0A8J2RBI8_9CRUS|nr:unnamed protein product [Daphnia galeata]
MVQSFRLPAAWRIKLKVKEGSHITIGQILFQFEPEETPGFQKESVNSHISNGPSKHVVRANSAGLLEKLHVNEGDIINQGSLILEYSNCSHPTVMKEMCAECGADLRETNQRSQSAAVAMVHNIPELMVSMKEATQLGKADEERLLRDRKLVLLVDLDQTLIHTTNDEIPANIEDVFHFQLHGPNSPWYHTRLRPFTKQLLCNISSLYELHICTFGSRTYAHMIANFLDEEGRALFPCGDHMVVIIDDREDVWNFAPNLIHVRPYHFFQHTGDINAPPGLAKQEKDDKEGFDFTSLNSEGNSSEIINGFSSKGPEKEKKSLEKVISVETPVEDDVCKYVEVKQDDDAMVATSSSTDEIKETKEITTKQATEKPQDNTNEVEESILEGNVEEKVPKQRENKSTSLSDEENGQIHIHDSDDYLLHLQDILRTIHHAYYELYDDNREETKAVPDMKIVLPYVRRKVLEEVHVVFSGVVPTNTPLEKSKPYLVAKSLGAIIMDRVSENTTHIIAARLGTAKLIEAKKYKHIRVVTPDWLWACAERWERVEERLYPLNSEFAIVRRKPPAHCTSPDVAFQLAIAASVKEVHDAVVPYYDRVTGKRVFRQPKRSDKGKTLATSRGSNTQKRFSETVNPLLSLSVDEIADMDREVEDILQDSDGGETDEEQEGEPVDFPSEHKNDEGEISSERCKTDGDASSSRKRKLEVEDHNLIIGGVIDKTNPENDTLMVKFRRGESIPVVDGDEPDDEDSNEPEIDELESDGEAEDSELCLAGQALEREFLSEED